MEHNRNLKVILIEDDPEDALLFFEQLESHKGNSFDFKHFTTLKKGIEALKQGDFDAIITDLGLPDSQGINAVEQLFRVTTDLPLIVLTGLNDMETGLKALDMGAQDFITKNSLTGQQIVQSIEYAISRKKVVDDLRNNHNLLHTIFNESPLIMIVIDVNREIIKVNSTGLREAGIREKDAIGKEVGWLLGCKHYEENNTCLIDNEECKNCKINKCIEGSFKNKNEFDRVPFKVESKKSGKLIGKIFNLSAFYIKSNENEMVLISLDDITELENAKARIEADNKKLTELNTTKDKFFSIIAHDLKSPFNNILGFSELLASNYQEFSDEEKNEFANVIYKSAQKTFGLLENLLSWARAQSGRITYSPEPVSAEELVSENIALLEDAALKKEIVLKGVFPAEGNVYIDRSTIDTVFRNLISNAIKFTPRGGSITVSLKGPVQNAHKYYEVCVADSGVGIPEEKLDGLFRIDRNNTTAGTENESGTGLGLILCKEFTEKNGGEIRVESSHGKGTKFFVSLPASQK